MVSFPYHPCIFPHPFSYSENWNQCQKKLKITCPTSFSYPGHFPWEEGSEKKNIMSTSVKKIFGLKKITFFINTYSWKKNSDQLCTTYWRHRLTPNPQLFVCPQQKENPAPAWVHVSVPGLIRLAWLKPAGTPCWKGHCILSWQQLTARPVLPRPPSAPYSCWTEWKQQCHHTLLCPVKQIPKTQRFNATSSSSR